MWYIERLRKVRGEGAKHQRFERWFAARIDFFNDGNPRSRNNGRLCSACHAVTRGIAVGLIDLEFVMRMFDRCDAQPFVGEMPGEPLD